MQLCNPEIGGVSENVECDLLFGTERGTFNMYAAVSNQVCVEIRIKCTDTVFRLTENSGSARLSLTQYPALTN
jgi:hypothetical protein